MSDSPSDLAAQGLTYEDCIALRWSDATTPLSSAESAGIEQSNDDILRILYFLDEYYPEQVEEHGLSQELARMDFKLNLVLDLAGEILSYYHDIPKRVPAQLGAHGIEWDAEQAPAPEQRVMMEIYPSPRYPRALWLTGRVRRVDPLASGFRVTVLFEDIAASTQEWLEKIVFRQHRRRVAYTRRK
ncbi:MAG: PilZ domain-containing protein [Pseudomonadota bacterium]